MSGLGGKPPIRRMGVRAGYDLWAEDYEATPNPVVAMDGRVAMELLKPAAGERILDAGCGTGRHLRALEQAGAWCVGVDLSLGMLRQAGRRRLVQADLQGGAPMRGGVFDGVLCTLIGEHLDRLDEAMAGLYGALRAGGRMVFTVYHPELAAAGIEANFERHGVEHRLGAELHREEDYDAAARRAGFEDLRSSTYAGDEELARALPKAAKLVGRKVIFALCGVRR